MNLLSESSVQISLVVAMDENGLIGAAGGLPWRLPADLKHFKRRTLGRPILMGRRTFESIGRPLPGRDNLVLSRDPAFVVDGVRRVADIDAAVDWARAQNVDELVVIGGAQVYALVLPRVDRLVLTRVHAACAGDTWFPELDWSAWHEVARETHAADDRHGYAFSFIDLERNHHALAGSRQPQRNIDMADLKADFKQAQQDVETLKKRPGNDDLLALYAYFKQVNEGDVAGKRPSTINLKNRAKHDAWAKLKGTDADAARLAYINKVKQLIDADV